MKAFKFSMGVLCNWSCDSRFHLAWITFYHIICRGNVSCDEPPLPAQLPDAYLSYLLLYCIVVVCFSVGLFQVFKNTGSVVQLLYSHLLVFSV